MVKMTSFVVTVKLNSQRSVPVQVHRHDTISTIKEQLCSQHGLKPEFLRIIFQGKLLDDGLALEDCDLGENSILHAVFQRQSVLAEQQDTPAMSAGHAEERANGLDSNEPNSGPSNFITNDGSLTNHESNSTHVELDLNLPKLDEAHKSCEDPSLTMPKELISPRKQTYNLYYVYCKSPCHKLCPGRIRVRCSVCKEGTIHLTQEPTCWEDVLISGQISGQCLSENCTGDKAEFYFKCNGHMTSEGPESVAVLRNVSANLYSIPCLTCDNVCCPVLRFICHTSHIMCLDCFIQYCNIKLDERQFVYSTKHGYTLGCPAGCENSLITDGHHFRLLGEEQYKRYQRFATEEHLLREGGVMCPAPGCGEGIFPDEGRRIQCVRPECQFVFCRDCRRAYHETGDCSSISNTSPETTERWFFERRVCDPHEELSLSTIASISKPCPRCKVPVERNGGCMHMTCSRCEFEWCWLCHVAWSTDCQGNHWFG